MKEALSVRLHSFGSPADVVSAESEVVQDPGPGEVLVRMLAAPINPADHNVITGTYGELPQLPATIGNEGCGQIEAVGPGVSPPIVGDLVVVGRIGCWTTWRCLPADDVFVIRPGCNIHQAAMLSVNPPTALAMIDSHGALQPGDWIVQNAANSGVGRAVIQIARRRGLRTLNLVRRPELIDDLLAIGADQVVLEETDLRKETERLCDGRRPMVAFNAVGGTSALNIASALAPGGLHVTYGAMAKQPLKIPNGLLIFSDLTFRGFWLRRWIREVPRSVRETKLQELAEMVQEGSLFVPVAASYPLSQIHAALDMAGQEARCGKVLLDMVATD